MAKMIITGNSPEFTYKPSRWLQVGRGWNIVFNIIMALLALMSIVPMLLILSISLSAESSLEQFGYQFIPRTWSLDGYKYIFTQSTAIIRALSISVFVTVSGTVIGVILNGLMGYVLTRHSYKLNKFFTWFVFIPMIFNGGLVSSYFIIGNFLRLSNTIWVLILPLAVSSYNIILCRTFFKATIPDSLIESANIDGASELTIFFRLIVPLSKPVLATIALFLAFAYWNDWFTSLLYINNSNLYSLQAYLNKILGDIEFLRQNAGTLGVASQQLIAAMPKEAARMAIVVIAVVPIACSYPFFQRYFVSGLTVGALKG
ncbi:MAG: carbohydrate ABC transporter permease [Spirochaetaceae bacterium]|jgi:putative aldouronate transport system permease protein|nr:carbohydrate ABC transporter permease [Spirochaetaceae bacterium]